MTYSVQLSPEGVDARFSGALDGTDMTTPHDLRFTHPQPDQVRFILIDFTGIQFDGHTPPPVRNSANVHRRQSAETPRIAIAVVAPQPGVFGFSRMWQTLALDHPEDMLVAHSRDEAWDWLRQLGLSVDEAT